MLVNVQTTDRNHAKTLVSGVGDPMIGQYLKVKKMLEDK